MNAFSWLRALTLPSGSQAGRHCAGGGGRAGRQQAAAGGGGRRLNLADRRRADLRTSVPKRLQRPPGLRGGGAGGWEGCALASLDAGQRRPWGLCRPAAAPDLRIVPSWWECRGRRAPRGRWAAGGRARGPPPPLLAARRSSQTRQHGVNLQGCTVRAVVHGGVARQRVPLTAWTTGATAGRI